MLVSIPLSRVNLFQLKKKMLKSISRIYVSIPLSRVNLFQFSINIVIYGSYSVSIPLSRVNLFQYWRMYVRKYHTFMFQSP